MAVDARQSWKDSLADRIDPGWAEEIDQFESQLQLRKKGKLDEKVFAETRLRRGAYGQRYDNGKRHDGIAERAARLRAEARPRAPTRSGTRRACSASRSRSAASRPSSSTCWRSSSEEYSDGILHVTTRQDIQLHFVHIEDTPDLMRRLAAVGITTREACGNSVRNVTACPLAGVCKTEAFDVSPYAKALMRFLLGHPDVQDFGRKFKPAFSGCEHEACGLVQMHDSGYVARVVDGKRGFKVVVGGGLGPVPHQAKVLSEFTPEEELLPRDAGGGARVRAARREAEPRPRAHQVPGRQARHRGVPPARRRGAQDAAPRRPLDRLSRRTCRTRAAKRRARPAPLAKHGRAEGFDEWLATNVSPQRQAGYSRGDAEPAARRPHRRSDARRSSDLARKYVGDNLRTTVEQNIALRFVSDADLPARAPRARARSASPRPAPPRSST